MLKSLFFLSCFIVVSIVQAHAEIDVWLDVDPATGMIQKDVDDGLAMIQTFHSPSLKVRGISVVFGNSPLKRGIGIAEQIVEEFGPEDINPYIGAASAADFGADSPAVAAMAKALEDGPMTILALGPLTNVGTLLKNHPELHSKIESIILVAARRENQVFRPKAESLNVFPDFNFEQDPAAMAALLETEVPLVYAPWEVSSHLWITQDDLDMLQATGGTGEYVALKSRSWIRMWKRMFDTDGFNPFDTLAVAWLTHPELIESMEVTTWIDPREGMLDEDGKPLPSHLLVADDQGSGRSAIYCYRPSPELKAIILQRLMGDPSPMTGNE